MLPIVKKLISEKKGSDLFCGISCIKKFRQLYPGTNIVAIDYDPGASGVNQLNRIRMMLETSE